MTYGGALRPKARPSRLPAGWTDIEWLVAIERIKQTQALYCFCLDAKDWGGYEAVYAPDAVLEVGDEPGAASRRIEGAGPIRQFVEGIVGAVTTVHQCHAPVIDFLSTQEAHVAWAMEDMLRFPDGAPLKTLHGFGHYFQRLCRVGDDWLIAHNVLARLRLDTA